MKKARIGLGYDVHPLSEGRRLMLGGIEVPYKLGAEGHSDADVLLHALVDALLGAVAAGDIGHYFPDTDPKYKDISSAILLQETWKMIQDRGYELVNLDAVIQIERPRLAPYIERISEHIATLMSVSREQVSVKATRGEGLGFVGRGEGIAAQVIIMIEQR